MADALGPFSFRREPCKTGLMGIVNVTPDSFHESSRRANVAEAIQSAQNMIKSGAEIIDIGGESTRPGSQPVSIEKELNRFLLFLDFVKLIHLLPFPLIHDITKLQNVPWMLEQPSSTMFLDYDVLR